MSTSQVDVLLLEPFYGGSHKQLIDLLHAEVGGTSIWTLPAKKWHWKARTSALYFAEIIPNTCNKTLFASSVLNLAELVALRPDLSRLKKVLYFHENQLIYPVRKQQERDFQYGYNQILSCLVADLVLFNSLYNMESFLSSIDSFLKLIPDHRPHGISSKIQPKCQVLYFPINFPVITSRASSLDETRPLHILWAHRWEHDKGPDIFFEAIYKLVECGVKFHLSVLGESFSDIPDVFIEAKEKLNDYIINWGYQESKQDFFSILQIADVAVSTANHEFYGVSMLEAVHFKCFPLCPNKLVYPEIFPEECLYRTDQQLFKRLREFCRHPHLIRNKNLQIDTTKFSWKTLQSQYKHILKSDDS
ncbi:tRNA-queuosine alpha-mannosyltransferase-like [Saccoglossus kowalevskii]|uniref:tRNA-queuosine alpha-mannosyltransferase n=1 Tax=Saccoglossus kowalevskii TaxID=10224 RepID=A0ABM0GI94_SACKO|nr:PREDICTED: glycosyltransferase-like domain-containing protein 1-like [Saccoglossus kowalevskii]